MTHNYYFEFRFIPGLLDQVKQGKNPLLSLIDVRWMKEVLDKNNIDIDWDGFSIDVYDELYNKSSIVSFFLLPVILIKLAKLSGQSSWSAFSL